MVEVLGAKYFDSEDIIKMLKEKYKKQQFDSLGNISILSASFVVTTNDMLKEPNEEYIQRELEWYLSESLNVNDIPGKTPKIWEQVSDKDGFINSNYGWTTFSKENYSQFDKVLEELSKNNKYSRQGVIIFIRPTMHEDSKRNGMHDFICTYCYNFKIERDIDGIDKLYPILAKFNNAKSPNIQTYLAGIYRKIQVPDAFGPLVKMLIQNSLQPMDKNAPFDPNEEIGGAILSYLSDRFRH